MNAGLKNLRHRKVDAEERGSYAVLLHKVANLLLLNGTMNVPCAADLLEEGIRRLEESMVCYGNDAKDAKVSADWVQPTACPMPRSANVANQSLGVSVAALLPTLRQEAVLLRRLQQRVLSEGNSLAYPLGHERTRREFRKGDGKGKNCKDMAKPATKEQDDLHLLIDREPGHHARTLEWEAVD